MKDNTYQEPETQDLGEGAAAAASEEATKPANTSSKTATKTTAAVAEEPKFVPEQDVIGLSEMINAKGDAVTDVLAARIDRHIVFLAGQKGFKDDAERINEQTTFMDSVARTLLMADFDQFVVVTDHLLNKIRQNKDVFASGACFRFSNNLGDKYPAQDVATYRSYISLLIMVANNWAVRYKLNKVTDPSMLIRHLPKVGKQNITQYLAYLQRSV